MQSAVAKLKLRFALRDGLVVHVSDFDALRGRSGRPKDLRCPECELPVTVKLSPEHKIRDHFAHYPDSECPLRGEGESAFHLNAKIALARKLTMFHKASLAFQCEHCRHWYPYLEINDYDEVIPELKLGKRRPDITCLSAKQAIGAAEVYHTHAVTAEKKQDLQQMSLPWFEIPALSVHPRHFKHIFAADVISFDARAAGVTYPLAPQICEACAERARRAEYQRYLDRVQREQERLRREQAERLRHEQEDARREELRREQERQREALEQQRRVEYEEWKRRQEEARRLEAEKRAREQAEREEAERRTKAEQEEVERRARAARAKADSERRAMLEREWARFPPLLLATGDLSVGAHPRRHWWNSGQSVVATLAELDAPVTVWALYATRNDDLLTGKHSERCQGKVKQTASVIWCGECRYFAPMEGLK